MSASPTWAFDLDGCLVGTLAPDDLRPLARELLESVRSSGATLVVWSAGGTEYARRIAARTGIADLVDGFYDKLRGRDGKWPLEVFPPDLVPIVCVDDDPEDVPEGIRVLAVTPYLGRRPHDRGLETIVAIVRESRTTGSREHP
jgi:long-chain acyl-CoA synthetase